MNVRGGNTKVTFEADQIIQPFYTGGDVSLDASGRILATCLGGDAVVTDLHTGETLARIEGDGENLTTILITQSASHLVCCSRSLSMRIYSLEPSDDSKHLIPTLSTTLKPHNTPVVTAAVDATGTLLATGSTDGVIKVWDIRRGYPTHTFRGHSGIISALYFFEAQSVPHTNGSKHKTSKVTNGDVDNSSAQHVSSIALRLASGGEDGKIRIWDLEKRKAVQNLDSHVSVVRGLDFSPEQNALVSASRDKTFILWDARTWKIRKVVPALEVLEAVGFVGNSQYIYTGGEYGNLRIWESDSGREITREKKAGADLDAILYVLNPLQDRLLVCVHADQSLTLHDLVMLNDIDAGSSIDSLTQLRHISGTHDEVIDLAYVGPEKELLALATNSESLRLVSVAIEPDGLNEESGSYYFGADVALLKGHEEIIICLDVDWSGCWIATGAKDNTARLWRIDHANRSYTCFATLTGHAESLGAISLPGHRPAAGSAAEQDPLSHPPSFVLTGSQDMTVKRWSIAQPNSKKGEKATKAMYTRKAHDKDINALATNHDSTLFASASQDRTVKIWSVEEGEVQGVLRGHKRGVWSVKFAPKDAPSITSTEGMASGSRGFVITGSGDKTVKIWSLASYACLLTLEGHVNSVLKVLWLPPRPVAATDEPNDSNVHASRKPPALVASAGGDGLVKIWNASTGDLVSTLDNHTDRVWALAAHPTLGTLVSGGGDSVVTFWRDTTAATAAASAAASTVRVEQEQSLENYARRGNYRAAIVLALTLNHPARLLALLTSVVNTHLPEAGSLSGVKAVDEVLRSLDDEQLYALLLRLRDWNTNARTAPVAQRVLWVVVRSYSAERLAALQGRGRKVGEVLEGLRVYTQRHFKRMEELVEESYLVDFVVGGMGVVGDVGDGKIDFQAEKMIEERDVIMV